MLRSKKKALFAAQ
jgi:hypothetical protein